jgi:uncharacterized protein (TIGR02270 family)
MTTTALTFAVVPDIVEEHCDELQFLWTQRRNALRSSSFTERALRMLEERIEAHVDGMLVAGERMLELVEPCVVGEEEMPAFAAAFTLLRRGSPDGLRRVLDAFQNPKGQALLGLRDGLAHGHSGPLPDQVTQQLTSLFMSAGPAVGAAAGEVLAFHNAISPDPRHLERFVHAEDATARESGWRLAAYCGVAIQPASYERGLRDEEAGVRRAALAAAAWTGSATFLPYCRSLAADPNPDTIEALALFAAVAPPEEYQTVAAVASNPAAGPDRFRVVGAFAHPYFIEFLIKEMENPDPAAAAVASAAFEKMTDRSPGSQRRAKVSPDGKPPADEFEAEFQEVVVLPDPARARKYWEELAPRLASSPRVCRGLDVSQSLSRDQFAALDMESRWEYCLRMRLFSGWQGTPLVLERYPQRL